jgi:outer membrane lipoprotein SlyB
MSARTFATVASVSALLLITACSSNPPRSDPYASAPVSSNSVSQYGNVSNIEVVSSASRGAGGAVLGAVIGAVIGNQIGSGSGRAAATGVGAVGGAIIGNNLQKRNDSDVYRISVRLDNGSMAQFDYQSIDDLRVGDRVHVNGGQLHRV